jgi:ABC-type molybdate transport system substrate-binding protein
VLVTETMAMDQAETAGIIDVKTRVDGFSTALVLAGPRGWNGDTATSRIAVTDATVISGLDGRAVLAANNISPAAVQGAACTADVAFLVLSGTADAGLMYQTDVGAEPRLLAGGPLKAEPAQIKFSAAVNAKSTSPNAQNFIALLQNSVPALQAGGLSFS